MSRCSGRSPRQSLLCPLSEPSWWAGPFPKEGDQSREGSGNQAWQGHVEKKGNVCRGRDDVNAAVKYLKGCYGEERWLKSDWLNASYRKDLRNPIKHPPRFTKDKIRLRGWYLPAVTHWLVVNRESHHLVVSTSIEVYWTWLRKEIGSENCEYCGKSSQVRWDFSSFFFSRIRSHLPGRWKKKNGKPDWGRKLRCIK